MARKKKKRDMWETEFKDISSHSPGVGPTPAEEEWQRAFAQGQRGSTGQPRAEKKRRQKRPPAPGPEQELPRWEAGARPKRPPASPPRGTGPENRPAPRKRPKDKPKRNGVRKAAVMAVVLVMAAITALLVIFLLFKVSSIQVTGDVIEGCASEDIIALCGYKVGDNLVFLSTGAQEEKIEETYPRVGKAKISKRFPATVEIELTAAKTASCAAQSDCWLSVSDAGRVLSRDSAAQEGVLKVYGLSLEGLEPGQSISREEPKAPTEEDEEALQQYEEELAEYNALQAYEEIAGKLGEMGDDAGFTALDLSNLSDIRLYYQDRIEFKLGPMLELPYKIDLGCRSLEKMLEEGMDEQETGVMDLSLADTTSRAVYTTEEITLPTGGPDPVQEAEPADDATPAPTPAPTPEASSESPRAEDIPDSVFTG